jgi:23S rRNA U2552 (ribose-2'-O)-methylase RlmE/FtsJ
VAQLNPVSRSFYKLIEIINYFNILDYYKTSSLKTFHLAEGPGGFIEAIEYLRRNENLADVNTEDEYWGLTLLEKTYGIPSWSKLQSKINKYGLSNINFFLGKDNRGDLYDIENFTECVKTHKNSCDILTGDGGFDFSLNFADQEKVAVKLLLVQSLYAIMMQKKSGTFIIKFFDMFTYASMELLYLLKSFYKIVIITKPKTSRYANSERYIVCRDFMMNSTVIFEPIFKDLIQTIKENDANLVRFLNVDIPHYFKLNLEQSNILLGKQQLTTINNTNQLIQAPKNDKITKLVKNNREKCVRWCVDNNIPYNKVKTENIFLKKTINN